MNPWKVKAVGGEPKPVPEAPEGNLCLPTQRELRSRLWRMGKMRLADYFQGKHWRQVIQDYRDCGLPLDCRECGQAKAVLRHVTLERLGQEWLEDLIPLCAACYRAAHAWERWRPHERKDPS